jgi:hypothetical protein
MNPSTVSHTLNGKLFPLKKRREKFCQAPLNAEIQNRGIVKNIGI